ncbi:MAG TPA: hypothetical protein VE991_04240 [Acidimicrobiales bacterium]|nr:hypothetical protein [Acidimicrobiales bacterium]
MPLTPDTIRELVEREVQARLNAPPPPPPPPFDFVKAADDIEWKGSQDIAAMVESGMEARAASLTRQAKLESVDPHDGQGCYRGVATPKRGFAVVACEQLFWRHRGDRAAAIGRAVLEEELPWLVSRDDLHRIQRGLEPLGSPKVWREGEPRPDVLAAATKPVGHVADSEPPARERWGNVLVHRVGR